MSGKYVNGINDSLYGCKTRSAQDRLIWALEHERDALSAYCSQLDPGRQRQRIAEEARLNVNARRFARIDDPRRFARHCLYERVKDEIVLAVFGIGMFMAGVMVSILICKG